jgi:hypothetical protein
MATKKPKVDQNKESGIFTEGMPVPQDIDGASATPTPKASAPKPVKKYAKGGSIDGIAQRGKTRGKMC